MRLCYHFCDIVLRHLDSQTRDLNCEQRMAAARLPLYHARQLTYTRDFY